jgi:lipopolysaccharide export system permease protein
MLRILDKYVLGQFARMVGIGVLAFVTIFITLNMVEKVDDFIDNHVPVTAVFQYYAYQVPYIFTLTLPVAVLIASLFTVGQMARTNELIAMRASGVRFARIIVPLVVGGLVASLVSIAVSEFVQPQASAVVDRIANAEIKRSSSSQPRIRRDVTYRGKNGLVYSTPEYDTRFHTMKDLVVEQSQEGRLVLRINAEKAVWKDSLWVVSGAWVRWFSREGEIERETFIANGPFPLLRDNPVDILREQRNPEDMSYRQLRRLVQTIRQSGGDASKYRVALAGKIAFPFASLIVVLVGAPLTARLKRGGLAVGVGIGLGLAFLYYGMMKGGQAMGDHALLPPILAAWLSNIVFAVCGAYLIIKAEKY